MNPIKIRDKIIGEQQNCYFIAEIGNNYEGDKEKAKKLIIAAAESGADAVKFQTFKATDIVSPFVKSNEYPGWDVSDEFEYWYQFVQTLEMPLDWYDELIELTRNLGLAFISTPASYEAAKFLSSKSIDALKIASMDLNNYPFLSKVDKLGLPVIISTGMSSLMEIKKATDQFKVSPHCLLHCVSNYPLDKEDANLLNITMLKEEFNIPVGFSNHALGNRLDIMALTLGASIIEKHFTFDRNTSSVAEHHFSITPEELKNLIEELKSTSISLGSFDRVVKSKEKNNKKQFRRSLYSNKYIAKNKIISEDDIVAIRPGTGLEPANISKIIGKKAIRGIKPFELLKLDFFK